MSTGFATIDCYHFILQWAIAHKGNTPSLRQIAAGCNFSGATAHYHKQVLIKQGLLEIIDGELCVVRAKFTLPDNAYEMAEIERIYPDIASMNYIPKEIDFVNARTKPGIHVSDWGIILGEAADEEFLFATYPSGWRYVQIGDFGPLKEWHLQNAAGLHLATIRFDEKHYRSHIYFYWED